MNQIPSADQHVKIFDIKQLGHEHMVSPLFKKHFAAFYNIKM